MSAPAPLTVTSWPTAILHVDADSFFASCEQALHPELRGKPVITGMERGIIAAASYEAKAQGVDRGMRVHEARRICPDLICVPSDYESYSLYSLRMFEILKRFSPQVEEYSIDEAFVDLAGLRRRYSTGYRGIAEGIQNTVKKELKLNVTVGVSLTKVLAKIASKHGKPFGLCAIPGRHIHRYLERLPVSKVWGVGGNTTAYMEKLGIKTALEFAQRNEQFVQSHFTRPFHDIWCELNGKCVYPLVLEPRTEYKSISKTKTFTPASSDPAYVFAQLSKNLENACIKARRYDLTAKRLVVYLRTQDFQDTAVEIRLTSPTALPPEMMQALRAGFRALFRPANSYRSTGVILTALRPLASAQRGLFDDPVYVERLTELYAAVDRMAARFGKHVIYLGSSMEVHRLPQHAGDRGNPVWRANELLPGETKRQRLGLLMLDVEV